MGTFGPDLAGRVGRSRLSVLALVVAFASLTVAMLGIQPAAAQPLGLELSIDKTTVYHGDLVTVAGSGPALAASLGHEVAGRLDGLNGPEIVIGPFGSTMGVYEKVRMRGGVPGFLGQEIFDGLETGRHTIYVQTFPTADHSQSPTLIGTIDFNYVATPIPGPFVYTRPSAAAPGDSVTVTFEHIKQYASGPEITLRKGGPTGPVTATFGPVVSRYFTTASKQFTVPVDAAPGSYWVGYVDPDIGPVGTTLTVSGTQSPGIFGSLG